jgi:pimeloyl-ACP methyl ester carboxylesterase
MNRSISGRDRARAGWFVPVLCVFTLFAMQVPSAMAAGVYRDKALVDARFVSDETAVRASAWNSPARATAKPKPCADDPAFLCGSIKVPLDRANPSGEKIRIAFEILPSRNPKSKHHDPIFVTAGGPGASTTAARYYYAFVTEGMNAKRDVVLIDPRGTGKSGVLRCGALQNGWNSIEELESDVGACGEKLGDAADRYGSGDIALDVDAVRRALGYRKINYVSSSYATVHGQAYAVRFPEHLRAIVADSGFTVTDPEHTWQLGLDVPESFVRAVSLACDRAPACAAAHPDAGELFVDLVHRVSDEPITGTALDAFGEPHEVVVNEAQLAVIINIHILNPGEIAAAAVALENDDPAPLLRLAAESPAWPGDEGDPREFSVGANAATYCNDQDMVWDRDQTPEQRAQAYAAALEALPDDVFEPFTIAGWEEYWFPTFCIEWPAPDRFEPAVPAGATVPDVPVLVLSGDIDTIVPTETAEGLTDVYPNATVVHVAGAGHDAFAWGPCPNRIATRFINKLETGDTSCVEEPSFVGAAVPEYPLVAAEATPATPIANAGDESSEGDRRVATVVIRTVLDAWLRSFRQPVAVATGPGLRGGTFDANYRATKATVDLHRAKWVEDVAVSGETNLDVKNSLKGDVTFRGAGTERGQLHFSGHWGFGGPFSDVKVRGTIGGRQIAVNVPTN